MVTESEESRRTLPESWRAAAMEALEGMTRRTSRYYRRGWNESRGDSYDSWGTSTWYFWTLDSEVQQQVESYAQGITNAYDWIHDCDEFGGRSLVDLDPEEWQPYLIGLDTYQRETYRPAGWDNRRR